MNFLSLFQFGAGDIGSYATVPFRNLGGNSGLLTQILTFSLVVGGLFFFLYFLIGALQWLTAGGDKAALEGARSRLYNALIGLILIVGAFAIISIIEVLFKVNILSGFTIIGP